MPRSHPHETFIEEVGRALTNLYDPARLRKSWLLDVLDIQDNQTPQFALTQLLRNAIESFRPDPATPPESKAWQVYDILTRRFVVQQKQKQVAAEVGFSIRQMRRREKQAIRVLADYLWHRHGVQERLGQITGTSPTPEGARETTPSQEQELAWLQASFPRAIADIAQIINPALRHVAPLMKQYQVQVQVDLPEDRPPVTAQITLLRQVMLNFFSAAIRSAPSGRVLISARVSQDGIDAIVTSETQRQVSPQDRIQIQEELDMTRKLIELMDAQLFIEREQPLYGWISLPIVEQTAVLVVDDNEDTLRLLQRYLTGTRYLFIGATNAAQALALAEKHAPSIIVLDVMLPGVDGWELLARMREHPRLQDSSIIVSTILPQEQVALTLGAAAFLRKPVSHEDLLAVLDEQNQET
jgi:CheY-like chemotaxis protein